MVFENTSKSLTFKVFRTFETFLVFQTVIPLTIHVGIALHSKQKFVTFLSYILQIFLFNLSFWLVVCNCASFEYDDDDGPSSIPHHLHFGFELAR